MDDFKGTKGEWQSNFNGSYWEVRQKRENKVLDISVFVLDVERNPKQIFDEAEANAQLIAAAPELLEALQNVFVHAKTIINENHPDYKLAVKAINKALGK